MSRQSECLLTFILQSEVCPCSFAAAQAAYWNDNNEPLLKFLESVHMGVKGIVFDVTTNSSIEGALVEISGTRPINTTELGEYWRLLLPGEYTIQVSAEGFETYEDTFTVDGVGVDQVTLLDIELTPQGHNNNGQTNRPEVITYLLLHTVYAIWKFIQA